MMVRYQTNSEQKFLMSKLRSGSLFSGRLGIYDIDNDIEMTEVSERNLSKTLKDIIQIQNKSLN